MASGASVSQCSLAVTPWQRRRCLQALHSPSVLGSAILCLTLFSRLPGALGRSGDIKPLGPTRDLLRSLPPCLFSDSVGSYAFQGLAAALAAQRVENTLPAVSWSLLTCRMQVAQTCFCISLFEFIQVPNLACAVPGHRDSQGLWRLSKECFYCVDFCHCHF